MKRSVNCPNIKMVCVLSNDNYIRQQKQMQGLELSVGVGPRGFEPASGSSIIDDRKQLDSYNTHIFFTHIDQYQHKFSEFYNHKMSLLLLL